MSTKATCRRDQTFVIFLQQFPVHSWLVVVALKESQTRQLNEVLVTHVVLGKQREVVVQLAATLGVATRVIDLTTTTRAFKTSFVGHIGLGTNDWLDALGPTFFIEVENSVHVAVIGHSEGRLAISDGFGDEFIEFGCPIEHGKLGVNMEMGERVAQHQPPNVSVEPDLVGVQIS